MRYLKQAFLAILLGSGILYLIASYLPGFGVHVYSEYSNIFVVFLFLGIASWICNVVLKGVLKILTIPLSMLSMGAFSLLLNFLLLYVFEQFVNYLNVGVVIQLGSVVQVFALSCVLSLLYFLLAKIK